MFLKMHDTESYNKLDTDYKAEIMAYNLLKYHREIDEVFLKRMGSNNRAFNKDVKNIKEEYYDLDERIVSIETYREGIYDYLPEGIFHPPSLRTRGVGVKDVIEQIKTQKKLEENARKFLQPFELELYYSHLNGLVLEGAFDPLTEDTAFMEMLGELWPLLNRLDVKSAQIFAHLLPYFHAARGKREWIEKCISAFLGITLKVTFLPNQISEVNDASSGLVLSEIRLGISTVLTGHHFDGERNWLMTYGPIPYSDLHLYMPNSDLRELLQVIYDYCLPVTVNVEEYFYTFKKDDSFLLEGNQNNSLLGYSTYL